MEKIKREKLFMKIICICLAVVLWFYVSYFENPTMTKTVRHVPVDISDEQIEKLREKGLSIYSVSKDSVDVKVTARRLSLAKLTNKTLSAYINTSSINKSGTYTLPANVVSEVSSGSSYYVKGKDIKVVVEPILTGTFDVEVNVDSTYMAYDTFNINTETITVSAPESIFNEIGSIKTEHINIDEKIKNKTVALIVYDKAGKVIDKEIAVCTPEKIEIQFSYFDEKTVPVVMKTDDGKSFTLPLEYNVKIYGAKETLNTVSSVETASLNLELYEQDSTVKIKLNLPEGVKVLDKNREIEITLDSSYFE